MGKADGWVEVEEGCEYPEAGQIAFVNMKIGDNFAITTWAEYIGDGCWKALVQMTGLERKVKRVTHWAKFDMAAHMKSIGLAE